MEELQPLPGEVINLRLERVGVFFGSTCGLEPQGGHGSLIVTNYQMSFNFGGKKPISVPHLNVVKVTKRDRATDKRSEDWDSGGSAANPLTHKMGMVQLERRDTTPMTIVVFAASTLIDDVNDELYPNPTRQCSKLFECLMSYIFPRSLTKVFAFSYRAQFDADIDGWRMYNPDEEFARQGIMSQGGAWRVSHVNHEYTACESYPRKVAVPAGIRDWEVKKALEFRANGRFPVMVWKNPKGDAVICRSAQPLPGLFRMRNKEDERLVSLIREANASPSPLYIIDARPHTNAQANTVFRAAGYERGSYENCEILFLGIENIHAVRKSYLRLRELCTSAIEDDERWLQNVSETYWLQHISKLLQGSRRIAELVMIERASVLIHCSDGWDRTPQISALAQMMIDPYYRTIRGFEVLVEKEWCSLGHKFSLRYAHGGSSDKQEASPVIVQWADGIWQMMRQFPTAFEINDELLLELVEMVHVCKFGTFLFNTEYERRRAGVHKRTVSFWSHINANLDLYRNTHYQAHPGILFPETSIRRLNVWEGIFFKDCSILPPPHNPCPVPDLEKACSHEKQRVEALEQQIAVLRADLEASKAREKKVVSQKEQLEKTVRDQGIQLADFEASMSPGSQHGANGDTQWKSVRRSSSRNFTRESSSGSLPDGDGNRNSDEWNGSEGGRRRNPRQDSNFSADSRIDETDHHDFVQEKGRSLGVDDQVVEALMDVIDAVAAGEGEMDQSARRNFDSDSEISDDDIRLDEQFTEDDDSAGGSTTDGAGFSTEGASDSYDIWLNSGESQDTVNPLQQPFGKPSESGGESGRRRKRGAKARDVPYAVSLEAPLDESSTKWIPDQGVTQCFKCKKSFDLFNRRHHCRCCGRIFCNGCSSQRSRISKLQIEKEVRVCKRCFDYLQRLQGDS